MGGKRRERALINGSAALDIFTLRPLRGSILSRRAIQFYFCVAVCIFFPPPPPPPPESKATCKYSWQRSQLSLPIRRETLELWLNRKYSVDSYAGWPFSLFAINMAIRDFIVCNVDTCLCACFVISFIRESLLMRCMSECIYGESQPFYTTLLNWN